MKKTILITGATDGIGLETAKMLLGQGHKVLLHGRNAQKLAAVEQELSRLGDVESHLADLSRMDDVRQLGKAVAEKYAQLDVLINNAGIYKTADPITADGIDVRFAVNTLAPYLLTKLLLPQLGSPGRVVNLSSAAQAPIDLEALSGTARLDDMAAYAQSKLALTIWSQVMGQEHQVSGPVIVAVNPGSFLASKMVKEGFGVAGSDLGIGAEILCRAALSDEFATACGRYFDNDAGRFSSPHPEASNQQKVETVMQGIEDVLALMN